MAKGGVAIQITPESLKEKVDQIEEIDSKLEAASGSATAGVRALRNRYAASADEQVNQIVSEIQNFLSSLSDEQRFGVYFGLSKKLDDLVGNEADNFVKEQAEKNKSQQPEVSADEVAELREQRKQLYTEFQALKGILIMHGHEDAIQNIPEPKVLRGAPPGQKRGPRAINQMRWTVDGNEVPADKSTLSGVAETVGGIKAKDLREAIKAAGVDTKNPPDTFQVEVNGKTVVANKQAA